MVGGVTNHHHQSMSYWNHLWRCEQQIKQCRVVP